MKGVARTDRGGAIDDFSTYAPDGILGPHHEKESSYYTIRDLWSPVQIATPDVSAAFDGTLHVSNAYDFTPLTQISFQWRLVRFAAADAKTIAPIVLASGTATGPAIAPHASGVLKLDLPKDWRTADALMLTATGADKQDVWTWSWPLSSLSPPRNRRR